jgi:D-2-hydroxyacid dehydrogenase (NADP+)
MTNVLIVLRYPDELRLPYLNGIRAAFPDVTVTMVRHVDGDDPALASVDAVVGFGALMSDEALAKAVNLKWVQMLSTGYDAIINRPALPRHVIVTNIPGIHAASVSEAALMFMLALSRDLPRAVHNKDRHVWGSWAGPLLEGKTVGILGVGLIAEGLAPRCRALGMKVIGITSATRELPGFDAMRGRDELVAVAREVDFLVVLTPYTKDTHRLIGEAVFAAMKPTSYLINLARGKIIDEAALLKALDEGRIAGAAIDVASTEPLPADDPLWEARNLVITPHLAGMYDDYADRALAVVNENLRHFSAGHFDRMINVVRR